MVFLTAASKLKKALSKTMEIATDGKHAFRPGSDIPVAMCGAGKHASIGICVRETRITGKHILATVTPVPRNGVGTWVGTVHVVLLTSALSNKMFERI